MAKVYRGVPEGASAVIPRLVCVDVEAEIEFCCEALGAEEGLRRPGPDGKTAHALLRFGSAMLMLESEWPTLPSRAPSPDGTSPVVIYLYVEDVDATLDRAVHKGAKVLVPIETQFWGDRIVWIQDPAGHVWTLASRVEQTTEQERASRWEKIRTTD
jgi:PhnB protein